MGPFFQDLVVTLVAALVVLLPSRRLRLPPAVGFMITGVLIGPAAFRLVQDPHDVEVLAEVGVSVLLFAMSGKELAKQVLKRSGQCVMTSPTSALFAGIESEDAIKMGAALRFFGDGFQISKVFAGKRYWRIPVMDGEFLCEEHAYAVRAVGGGNILILGRSRREALLAAERAVEAMQRVGGVVLPFPGGIVRSGSKVGSKYKNLIASTNDSFCPTLKGLTDSELSDEVESVMEIVIDGVTESAVAEAMAAGMKAICGMGEASGVTRISAGNYGGKLGQFQFHLRKILA